MAFSLEDLEALIATRGRSSDDQSYTAKLLNGGPPLSAKKLGEEAVEVVIAAIQGDRRGLVNETADVLYHLLVVLRAANIPLAEVLSELDRRTAQSGIAEKASRPKG